MKKLILVAFCFAPWQMSVAQDSAELFGFIQFRVSRITAILQKESIPPDSDLLSPAIVHQLSLLPSVKFTELEPIHKKFLAVKFFTEDDREFAAYVICLRAMPQEFQEAAHDEIANYFKQTDDVRRDRFLKESTFIEFENDRLSAFTGSRLDFLNKNPR